LTLNGWRTASTAARKFEDPIAKPTRSPASDEVGEAAEQVERRVGVVVGLELDVGLVEDDGDVTGNPVAEGGDLGRRQVGRGRVVGVADDHQLGRGGDLGGHRIEVVDLALGERYPDLPRPGEGRQVRVHRERGPGEDDLGARLAERVGGGEQDLAGPVADRDPAGLGLVALGQAAAQQRRVGVGVAVHRPRGLADRLDHLRVRWDRRLVRGELGDPGSGDRLRRVSGRDPGLVAGHPGELLGEGDGHRRSIVPGAAPYWAAWRSERSAWVGPR
jgi:hypothetical protein